MLCTQLIASMQGASMFGDIIAIVNLIRSGIEAYGKSKTSRNRKKVVLNVLKAYFIFKDCVDEGEALLSEAAPDPVEKLNSMDAGDAVITLQRWNAILDRQSWRLQALHDAVLGQHHLEVLNPALQRKIKKIIGNKMDDVQTLAQVGAALVIRNMFNFRTKVETPNYILSIAYSESNKINLDKLRRYIMKLRHSLDGYRQVLRGLVSSDELTTLSKRARSDTLIPSGRGYSGQRRQSAIR
jgi:hypothetical protein